MSPPETSSFVVEDNGVLYLTIARFESEAEPKGLNHIVLFCPFCGAELQTRKEIQERDQVWSKSDGNPAFRLLDELTNLVLTGPGKNMQSLARANAILKQLVADKHTSEAFRANGQGLGGDLVIWFSHRRWSRYGQHGYRLERAMLKQIRSIKIALETVC